MRVWIVVFATTLLVAACGPGGDPGPGILETPDGFGLSLSARSGPFLSGSRRGTSVLVSLRDLDGFGPSDAWEVKVRDGDGAVSASQAYLDPTQGSAALLVWPDQPYLPGTRWWIEATAPGKRLDVSLVHPDVDAPLPAAPTLAADASHLAWEPVPGAVEYHCEVLGGGFSQLVGSTGEPRCATEVLPDGSYTAVVTAHAASLASVREDKAQRPSLPEGWFVTETAMAFAISGGRRAAELRVAAGGLRYSATALGLAVLAVLEDASSATWRLEVTPSHAQSPVATASLDASRPELASFYSVAPHPGRYKVVARSLDLTLTTYLGLGEVAALGLPSGATPSALPNGAASLVLPSVEGARSYRVSVWSTGQGAQLVAQRWTQGPQVAFPEGTFAAGSTYHAYVTALSADLSSAALTASLAASEDAYQPVSFVAQ